VEWQLVEMLRPFVVDLRSCGKLRRGAGGGRATMLGACVDCSTQLAIR
jgi:hypothetical protein